MKRKIFLNNCRFACSWKKKHRGNRHGYMGTCRDLFQISPVLCALICMCAWVSMYVAYAVWCIYVFLKPTWSSILTSNKWQFLTQILPAPVLYVATHTASSSCPAPISCSHVFSVPALLSFQESLRCNLWVGLFSLSIIPLWSIQVILYIGGLPFFIAEFHGMDIPLAE